MSKLISIRLEEKEIEELNEAAELENLDRSTLLRKMIKEKVKEIRMGKMASAYHNSTMSLQEAATAAKVSLYEMMDYVEQREIYPKEMSDEEMEEHFSYAQEVLRRKDPKSD